MASLESKKSREDLAWESVEECQKYNRVIRAAADCKKFGLQYDRLKNELEKEKVAIGMERFLLRNTQGVMQKEKLAAQKAGQLAVREKEFEKRERSMAEKEQVLAVREAAQEKREKDLEVWGMLYDDAFKEMSTKM